jgi:signal transduction histidine kinase
VTDVHTSEEAQPGRLAEEQAALRRVATLVAQGAEPPTLFAVVAEQVARVLHVPRVSIVRFETDGTEKERAVFPGAGAESAGIGSTVRIPVAAAGRTWGAMIVSATDAGPLRADTEARLANFTELLATAIANTEAQAEVARLTEEQAALRRVATRVAQGWPADKLCDAVIEEVGRLLGADLAGMIRYEGDDTVAPVAVWSAAGEHPPTPDRWPLVKGDPAWLVAETRSPRRIDDWAGVPGPLAAYIRDVVGIRSSVGSPILVEGHLWGALAVHSKGVHPLPPETELRLENFTELVATAIANADARTQVQRLADEQAALRRVATLVARESPETAVLATVAEEVSRLLGGEHTHINRYETDGLVTCVAAWGRPDSAGLRFSLDGDSITARVLRTGRPARLDDYSDAAGQIGEYARKRGLRSGVGVPILVDGRLWGVMVATVRQTRALPPDTEARMAEFSELVATAISNLQARSALAASRARLVAAGDEERRRVVRDLHDGAQQRLVHTVITLKLASQALQKDADDGPELVQGALEQAEQAMAELRELAQGILPAALTTGGLRAGVDALAARMPIPVDLHVSVERLPPAIEATAYFVVAEALTNVVKHSAACRVEVSARVEGGTLGIEVRDDGRGGAGAGGSGLVGLADRLAAVDGRLAVDSAPGRGTSIAAAIPLP